MSKKTEWVDSDTAILTVCIFFSHISCILIIEVHYDTEMIMSTMVLDTITNGCLLK